MRRLATAMTAATLALVATLLAASGTGAQSTVNVETGNLYFCDSSFENGVCETTITVGDTVVWDNVAGVHTVTQCDDTFTTCPPAGGFDSGILTAGATFSHTFDQAGTFTYWCAFHPIEMRGRILVQEPTPTPSPEPTAEPTPTPEGQTPTPTAAATPTPAGVPSTGGPPDDGGSPWLLLALLIGVAALGLGAMALRRLVREV